MLNPSKFVYLLLVGLSLSLGPLVRSDEVLAECGPANCVHGVCIAADGEVKCFCFAGFTGFDCSVRFDFCRQGRIKCRNNSTCLNEPPAGRCLCAPGYCGQFCELEIDECLSRPCRNGGLCLDKPNDFECLCPPGYTGRQCEVDADACALSDARGHNLSEQHCLNGGTCHDGPGLGYACLCPPQFTGRWCEVSANFECPHPRNPCHNGGQCRLTADSFECLCALGWSGRLCEKPLVQCREQLDNNNTCQHGGVCMQVAAEFAQPDDDRDIVCYCPPDYGGRRCELHFDECAPNNCVNGGTCIDGVGTYSCACADGFGGQHCQIDCRNEDAEMSEACQRTTTTTMIPSTTESLGGNTSTTEASFDISLSTEVTVQPTTTTTSLPADPMDAIFAARFTAPDSRLVFKLRRLKRMSTSIKLDLMPETIDDGTVLVAEASRQRLSVRLKEATLRLELFDRASNETMLEMSSIETKLDPNGHYRLEVTLSGTADLLLDMSLFLVAATNESFVIDKMSHKLSNLSVPCFETYQLGGEDYRGCIFNVRINDEPHSARDAWRRHNLVECRAEVCNTFGPCRNGGACHQSADGGEWSCLCPVGFRGQLCQQAHCEAEYCLHDGLCVLQTAGQLSCICQPGFTGARCQERQNLTFPMFNLEDSDDSFLKYRLPYDLSEFFEIRFRFISHELDGEAREALLMFIDKSVDHSKMVLNPYGKRTSNAGDFISLVYHRRRVVLRLSLDNAERSLEMSTAANLTEQMVLFGRYRQLFWLLVVPEFGGNNNNNNITTSTNNNLVPLVGHIQATTELFNIEPFLFVGGHEQLRTHPALARLKGFKGCIYDIDVRVSRLSNFTRVDQQLVDNLSNVGVCDFDCS